MARGIRPGGPVRRSAHPVWNPGRFQRARWETRQLTGTRVRTQARRRPVRTRLLLHSAKKLIIELDLLARFVKVNHGELGKPMLAEPTEVLAAGNVRNEQRQATSSSAQGRTARADVITRASSGSPQQHPAA